MMGLDQALWDSSMKPNLNILWTSSWIIWHLASGTG